jgi:hypothetical protein
MATKTEVKTFDDLEYPEHEVDADAGTIAFALDGKSYEIDLSKENAERLHDLLTPFIEAGRKVAASSRKSKARDPLPKDPANAVSRTRRTRNQEIRAWAQDQQMKINDRGRISEEVVEAFYKAHPELSAED